MVLSTFALVAIGEISILYLYLYINAELLAAVVFVEMMDV